MTITFLPAIEMGKNVGQTLVCPKSLALETLVPVTDGIVESLFLNETCAGQSTVMHVETEPALPQV